MHKRQLEAHKEIKRKQAEDLKIKQDAIREETRKIIKAGTGETAQCLDCREFNNTEVVASPHTVSISVRKPKCQQSKSLLKSKFHHPKLSLIHI